MAADMTEVTVSSIDWGAAAGAANRLIVDVIGVLPRGRVFESLVLYAAFPMDMVTDSEELGFTTRILGSFGLLITNARTSVMITGESCLSPP